MYNLQRGTDNDSVKDAPTRDSTKELVLRWFNTHGWSYEENKETTGQCTQITFKLNYISNVNNNKDSLGGRESDGLKEFSKNIDGMYDKEERQLNIKQSKYLIFQQFVVIIVSPMTHYWLNKKEHHQKKRILILLVMVWTSKAKNQTATPPISDN